MEIRLYHDLYLSQSWQRKKAELIGKLKMQSLSPSVYLITLPMGSQNQLECFSSILLKQEMIEKSGLFVVGMADGYEGALGLIVQITETIYQETGALEIRRTIEERQKKYDLM